MVLVLLAEAFSRFGELELPIVLALLLFGSALVYVRALETDFTNVSTAAVLGRNRAVFLLFAAVPRPNGSEPVSWL